MKHKNLLYSIIAASTVIILFIILYKPKIEGIYRSRTFEVLADGYDGYLIFDNEKIYITNLYYGKVGDFELIGNYKYKNGSYQFKFIHEPFTYEASPTLLTLNWIDFKKFIGDEPLPLIDNYRSLWPSVNNKIKNKLKKSGNNRLEVDHHE